MPREITVAVDFDGTLFDLGDDGKLYAIAGAKEALKDFRAQGYRVVIYTCRTGIAAKEGTLSREVDFITNILEANDLEYDEIFMGEKMVADVYIDDRAVPFVGDWNTAYREASEYLGGIVDEAV